MTARNGRRLLVGLLLCGCATDPYRFDAPRGAADLELAPYAMHEECVALARGDRFDFYFVSSAPIAFNINYHDANAVIMPLTRERVTQESGDFVADRNTVYCLMWEAGPEPSLLEYRLRPRPPR